MGRVFHYLRPYVWRIAGGLSLKFTGTIMDLLLPWALAHIVDVVIPRKDMGQVLLWGLFMLLFSGAGLVTSVLANRSASRVARDATRRIRHDLFARIAHLSSAQVDRFTIPSLISRMTSDTYNIHQVIGMMQRIGFRAPILLLGGVLITLTLDPVLTLVLVALLPFMGGAVFFISRRGTPLYQNVQRAADQLVRGVRENIAGVRVIKALSKEDYERRHFENANRQMMEREQKAALNMAFLRPTMNMVLNLGLVLVIAVGALRVNAGTSEVGKIMAFLSYFTIILNAMLSITRVLTMYSKASASAARIVEVLDAPPDLEPQPLPPTPGTARIRFEDVSFSYQKKELDLSHISFALEPGETLGIIGPTGAGKSTIVSLLLSGDSALFDETVSALRQYALSYLPAGLTIVLAGYFAALGKAGASALLSLGRGFLLLPAALMVLYLLGASAMIWTAALIGELLSLGLGLFLLRRNEAAAKKELDT